MFGCDLLKRNQIASSLKLTTILMTRLILLLEQMSEYTVKFLYLGMFIVIDLFLPLFHVLPGFPFMFVLMEHLFELLS